MRMSGKGKERRREEIQRRRDELETSADQGSYVWVLVLPDMTNMINVILVKV